MQWREFWGLSLWWVYLRTHWLISAWSTSLEVRLVTQVWFVLSASQNNWNILTSFYGFLPLMKEHRELAREAVRKSLVLLKNGESADTPLLPLPKKASKILVAGSHADNLGYQCGGWTIEWQGLSGNNLTKGTLNSVHRLFMMVCYQ